MKCSKCGGEIKNLPEYIEDTGAELLCTVCAGTAERTDDIVVLFDGYRFRASFADTNSELEVAA